MKNTIKDVVIVGGGTAGWISAALLVRMLGRSLNITLIESEQIGTVGVGEATIPPILALNQTLGLNEADFINATQATIKLGIEFEGWLNEQSRYMHAFGNIGQGFPLCDFEQFWIKGLQTKDSTDFWDYSLNYQAAKAGKFAKLERIPNTKMNGLVYAYHFDASLYANYLRDFSEKQGVKRVEGIVELVNTSTEDGFIQSVELKNGQTVAGDLFIDCSGFRGLLINQTLNVAYEDWKHWLPCDRAIAVQSESVEKPIPYTRSIAHEAGWRWQIPLQSRVGNGIVYSSEYLTDDAARNKLLAGINGKPINEPRVINFRTGRRLQAWSKNCIAVGLASGFLEPLESTSIHMVQSAITRLIKLFPHSGIKPSEMREYNRQTQDEIEHIRDFIILHYTLNKRSDAFWKKCQEMPLPESLKDKIQLFKESGKVFNNIESLFSNVAWQQVMIGQGVIPQDYHPLADSMNINELAKFHQNIKAAIAHTVEKLPSHTDFLESIK